MNSRKSRSNNQPPADEATLSLRIQPRSSKNQIVLMESGGYKVKLTAPPVDGAANEALVRLLADTLSLAKSRIEIVSGHTSRDKIVRIYGLGQNDVKRMLNTKDE